MAEHVFQVAIVGGGAGGITVAASLRRHSRHVRASHIAVVEPSDVHYYQPAFTLVGAGAYALSRAERRTNDVIPAGVVRIADAVDSFELDANRLHLCSGETLQYEFLVVCAGLQLDWDAIPGLEETLGTNGVCSNYSPTSVEYTWQSVRNLKRGQRALFTQPAMPIKCPGAPQKAAYLTSDYLRRAGMRDSCEVRFLTRTPSIFGVPYYARELTKIAARHGIAVDYEHELVEIDGPARRASFVNHRSGHEGDRITLDFDMLHVTPPQSAPDFVKCSKLANDAGFVDVDQATLQHTRYPNVFALGDVASTPNSKTAAAVRKQAPVVARNISSILRTGALHHDRYDGYASCPLTTAYGKVLMAEFVYGGKPSPTLPLDPSKERAFNWWIKKSFLPALYWNYMLKGYEAFPDHDRDFSDPSAA